MEDIEHWGKRAALPQSSSGSEEAGGPSINQGSDPGGRNAIFNPIYKSLIESKVGHGSKEEIMPDSIKGTSQIQFYYHAFFLLPVAGVNGFLDKDNIVQNLSSFHKPALIFRDQFWQEFFQSVSHNFGNDFIPRVAEGYRPKFAEIPGTFFFWDKCQE